MPNNSSPGITKSGTVEQAGNIGAGAQISGTVHQEFHVDSGGGGKGKWYLTKDVVIPVIVGLITALGGAYARHRFDIESAPERTVANTLTLIALSNEALALATQKSTSPEVIAKMQEVASQARAVEAAAALLGDGTKAGAQRADFWLRPGAGGIRLGDTISLGIRSIDPNGNLAISLNNAPRGLPSGGVVEFGAQGKKCFATYVSKSPDASLIGFNVSCSNSTS